MTKQETTKNKKNDDEVSLKPEIVVKMKTLSLKKESIRLGLSGREAERWFERKMKKFIKKFFPNIPEK